MLKARKHESLKLTCMAPVEKKRKIIKTKNKNQDIIFFTLFPLLKKATCTYVPILEQ